MTAIRHAACGLMFAGALAATPSAAQDAAPRPLDPAVAAEMVTAARAVLATTERPNPIASLQGVDPAAALNHELDGEEREDWSYWPRAREGLTLGAMNAQQRALTHDLLESLLSARGYLEVSVIMSLEQVLAATETVGFPRGEQFYSLSFYGEPSLDQAWGWSFEGHHVSLNVTMTPDSLSVTPSFLGSNPMRVTGGATAGTEALRYERRAAFALMDALSETQRSVAITSEEAPRDILSGQLNAPRERWDDWKQATGRTGLAATQMDDAQRALLSGLLDEVTGRYRDEIAQAERGAVPIDSLSFAWMGPVEEGAAYYYRVTGDDFVYEFDAAQDNGNHAHTVWRDRSDDFGARALERHYAEGGH